MAPAGEHLSDLPHDGDAEEKISTMESTEISISAAEIEVGGPREESVVLIRESFFGPPPPPPAKDYEMAHSSQQGKEVGESHFSEWGTERSDLSLVNTLGERLSTATTTTSDEITIHLTASTLGEESIDSMQRSVVMLHPLAMSPPSLALFPAISPVISQARIPQRPSRPSSLRLSSWARNGELTTSRIVRLDADRPGTSDSYSTQPHTGYTGSMNGSQVKFGRGRFATTELVPRPSDDPQDPLNWQAWRKELNLYALLVTVAMCSVMKTALVSVNNVLAYDLDVPYVAVAALTGLPLMISAGAGFAGLVASKVWGRRPVYLASMVLIFIGLVWNTKITKSYAQFMVARIFQGLGWGAFDTMVVGSITDTYFEHERSTKIAIFRIVSVATTWGTPLIGGVVSENTLGFNLQFEILAIFQLLSIPLLVFGAPETMYKRTPGTEKPMADPDWTPLNGWASLGLKSSSRFQRLPGWARGRGLSADRIIRYVKEVAQPLSYAGFTGDAADKSVLLQGVRALVAPTTFLAFLASFLPWSFLWGFSLSLSGLFDRDPFDFSPTTTASLLATPFILSTVSVAIFSLWPAWSQTGTAFRLRSTHLFVLGGGAVLSFIGTLGFGLYVSPRLDSPKTEGLRFSAISILLGLLAAGAYVLDAPATPLVQRSAQFTSPNLWASLRATADMDAGVTCWRTFFAGIFAMAIPAAAVTSATHVKNAGIAVAVIQLFVAGAVGAVWYSWEDDVKKLDGQVLGLVDWSCMERPRTPRSYFEVDD